jgi:hypothetical protein
MIFSSEILSVPKICSNFAAEMMDKKKIYHIIEWIVALAACGWLVWQLATYDDYPALWTSLRGMGWAQWLALAACVALMPVNMALEAWRWRTLLIYNSQCTMHNFSFAEAQKQVYYSKLAGLITPWKLGEYPARAVLMSHQPSAVRNQKSLWSKVLSMGAVGSATMTTAIIIAGVAAMMIDDWSLVNADWRFSYFIAIAIVLVLLALALALAPRLLRRWAEVSHRLVLISLGQSLLRLLCWCVQLGLVLWALGAVSHQLSAISLFFIYYLLVTVTPNVPIAEAGVRGAWAMWLFGTPTAALAGVLLWAINTLLPCLWGMWSVVSAPPADRPDKEPS